MSLILGPRPKVALIMGISNQRSIAWSVMERFLQKNWHVIYTVQNDKIKEKVERLVDRSTFRSTADGGRENILGGFSCDVTDSSSMETFFQESLPEMLTSRQSSSSPSEHIDQQSGRLPALHAVVHSLAFAPNLKTPLLETTRESFLEAHEVSSYSLIQVARESLPYMQAACQQHQQQQQHSENDDYDETLFLASPSLTTLSYLGAARAIPGYNVMGPAKASLESVVRGLALELGTLDHFDKGESNDDDHRRLVCPIRVNAIRAGPLPTLSSKGGIAGFDLMRQDVQQKAPLGNVTAPQVASSVYHVAAEAYGMTGQTIDVDGGYSSVAGPVVT